MADGTSGKGESINTGVPTGSARSRPDGMGTVGAGEAAGARAVATARGGRSHGTRGGMLGDTRRGSGGFCPARAAPGGYGKNRNESSVGSRNKISTAGTAIVGDDGGSYTSDESPRRRRKVVNLHTWPVCANNSGTSEEAKGSPPKTALSGRGTSPLEPTPGIGDARVRSPEARMRKIPPSSTGIRLLDPVRSCSVAGPGKRDRKSAFLLALSLRYSRV